MIDLPVGKALVAVQSEIQCEYECMDEQYKCVKECCKGCELHNNELDGFPDDDLCGCLCCNSSSRRDELKVVFKLVNYPG